MYQKSTLKNNLRIVTHEMKDRDSIALGFWVGVGGRYEQDRIKGAAHFLEHIVFKGSKKYKCEEIKERVEGVGGTLNAFTSEEQTCYYAKIPSKHLEQAFDVLSDMVFYPTISASDVSKESHVIVEEIKMYHDLPQYLVSELVDGLLWPDHPLGKNLTGTAETVSAMTNKDLRDFQQMYYVPSNVVVSACGHVKHAKLLNLVKNKLTAVKDAQRHGFIQADNSQSNPRVRFFKKDIEQMHLALGALGFDEYNDDRYILNLLSTILGGNMSSRLFVEIREKKGLAYSISASSKSMHDTGVFLIRAGVDNTKIVEATAVILKELEKIKRHGVSEGEFSRAKDYLLGQFLLGLEDTMENMLWIGESIISKNEIKTIKQIIGILNKIKRVDIQRIAQEVLKNNRFNLALVGPIEEKHEKQLTSMLGL